MSGKKIEPMTYWQLHAILTYGSRSELLEENVSRDTVIEQLNAVLLSLATEGSEDWQKRAYYPL